jgi:hypothetical protein
LSFMKRVRRAEWGLGGEKPWRWLGATAWVGSGFQRCPHDHKIVFLPENPT